MPAEFKQVKEIFLAAVEKASSAERAAWLREACGGDDALRRQVEALLRKHDAAGSFLEPPAPDPRATVDPQPGASADEGAQEQVSAPGEAVGSRIGPYKLLQQIGEGGMGTVYVAEQEQPVKRRVALKVIKPGMDSAQVIARFEAERQALALMDHTHIAKVLDAGTTDAGRPYFVMELVKGVPITKYCDELNLPIRERLALFVPVCQAIQHAHQKGIIHRDLKPSNVLIAMQDGRPVAKVIDFGVAKALHQRLTDRTLMTEFGAVVGTLEYMSPEQAELSALDIDTRADVYALGVLLYELLTGSTPLDKKRLRSVAYSEMLRIIREEEPPKPSTRLTESKESLANLAAHRRTEPARLTKEVRGELDWIVMKCLEKDRTRRYETANGLARDVQRYLADEAVEACPPSAGYKVRKFARRYKKVLATATAFVVLLVVGVVVSTWQAVRATVAEREARVAEAQAREDRDRAVRAEAEAREQQQKTAVAEAATRREADKARAINQFLVEDLLTQAEPERNAPADRVTLLEVVDQAAAKVGERFRDQPLLEASLRGTLGDVYHGLREYAKAEPHWSAALALRRRELGADHLETYLAMSKAGHMLGLHNQLEEGLGLARAGAAGLTRVLGPDHADTLKANHHLADALRYLRRHDEALPVFEQLFEKRKAVLGPDHVETLMSMKCLADAYQSAGKLDKALPLAEQALEQAKAALGPDHPTTLFSMSSLAIKYRVAGKPHKALLLFEQVFEKSKAKFGPDHWFTLDSMNNLARAYWAAGKLDKSIPLFEELLRRTRAKVGEDHPNTIFTAFNLAANYRDAKRLEEAIAFFDEWLPRSRQKLGPGPQHTFYGLSALAATYEQAKEFDRALPLYRELLDAQSRKLPADAPQRATWLAGLGKCLLEAGQPAAAEPVLRECLAIRENKLPDDQLRFNAQSLLGGSLLGQQKYAEAEPLLLQGYEGLKQREAKIPDRYRKVRLTEALERLVQLYDEWGKKDEAAKWRKELEEMRSQNAALLK